MNLTGRLGHLLQRASLQRLLSLASSEQLDLRAIRTRRAAHGFTIRGRHTWQMSREPAKSGIPSAGFTERRRALKIVPGIRDRLISKMRELHSWQEVTEYVCEHARLLGVHGKAAPVHPTEAQDRANY